MPKKTSSDPDYNGGGPGLGGMTPPSHWSGHSPPSGGQTSPQQAAAGHIAAVSWLGARARIKAGLAIKKRDAAQAVRDAGGSPETGTKTRDGMAANPRFGHRFVQKLLERNRRGLEVGEAALQANRAAGRRMSSMGGIRARQVNALEAEHGGHLPAWGPRTRREARRILSAESAARPSKQAGGGVPPLGSRTERLGRVNDALVARNVAQAIRAGGNTPVTGSKTRDDLASAGVRHQGARQGNNSDSPSGRARIKAGLRGNRAEDLGMRWGAFTASSARRRGFRRVDDLEARYGRAGQRDWGARTRAMAQELLDRERAIPSGRQAAVRAKIRRENKIVAALQERDRARAAAIGQSRTVRTKTRDELASLGRKDALPISQWPSYAVMAAKDNVRRDRAKKIGDVARARRRAAGKPADIMDLSQNARVQEVNALEAEHGRRTGTWGSETRRMARQKISDESHDERMRQIGVARRQAAAAPARGQGIAAPARGAPVAGGRRGTDPDSEFGNDMYRGGNRQRPKRASALTSPVRGPEPRADGKRHAEESLRLPAGHEFQDIDEIPPKGFPAHLDEVTPNGGGERLPIDLSGVTFKDYHHEARSGDDPEHMANFHAMTPGVRKTAAGKLFVQKIALPGKSGSEAVDSSRKSTNQEMIADRIFRILGVPAPRSQVYSLKTGLPVPHDYQWAPGEASTRLAEHLGKDSRTMANAPQQHQDKWEGHERRYAVAKALLDHGDDHWGNTMLDGKHMDVPWKVDNGSALKYDAFGKEKKSSVWGEVSPRSILFPQLYEMIGNGIVTPREAYRQMEGIAKTWRRHGGAIRELYKNDDDPKQAKIFASRAESIVRAVDMFKGPKEFARAMRTHFKAYDVGGRATTRELMPERKRKGSGLSTGGGSLTGSEFMARSFRWGMNV